jgi:hypothetical protein
MVARYCPQVKVRDAAEFTKVSRSAGGHVRITSDVLGAEDRLVEANAFLINPGTAKGLYTHHHTSVSLTYGFQKHLNSRLEDYRRSKQSPGSSNASAELAGQFLIDELMFSENPKELIKKLRRVKTAKMTTINLSSTSKIFQGYNWKPEVETIEVRFPEFADPAELADALDQAIQHNDLSRASVLGINQYGRDQRVTFGKNPLVLEQLEFADVMADFDVDAADLDRSIKALALSRTLTRMLDRPEIRKLTGVQ